MNVMIFTVLKATLAALGIVAVVSAAAGAQGARDTIAASDVVAQDGEVMETKEVV